MAFNHIFKEFFFFFFPHSALWSKCFPKLDALELPNAYTNDSMKKGLSLLAAPGGRTHTSLSFYYTCCESLIDKCFLDL